MSEEVTIGRRKLDVLQTGITIPVVITIIGIIVAGLASYYGGRLADAQSFSDIKERIGKVESSAAVIGDLKAKEETRDAAVESLKVGMAILLTDRGYNADKILSLKK